MENRAEMGPRGARRGSFKLPGGLLASDGRWLREVLARDLDGRDEERLSDLSRSGGAEEVSAFLADVVEEIVGLDRPPDQDDIDRLLIGDRDYLLLRLRQQAIGDRVHQIMRCPHAGCGEKVDVEFLISEIRVRRLETRPPTYELQLAEPVRVDDSTAPTVELRLPEGRDQVQVFHLAEQNAGRAATALLSRILLRIGESRSIDEALVRSLPLAARREVSRFLDAVVPGPDLDVEIACPHCAGDMTYPFDLHGFFLASGA